MNAYFKRYTLKFKRPSGTSRGILNVKDTWFIIIEHNGKTGIGECGMFRGLSSDDRPDFETKLQEICQNIYQGFEVLYEMANGFPSIQFGLEMAFRSLGSDSPFNLFTSKFTEGKSDIPINGLIWMGDKDFMKQQISSKIEDGFRCLKLKIGAIDFKSELALLQMIRELFSPEDLEIRVDANGAFSPSDAIEKLDKLSQYHLHSIEQPIKQGQWDEMTILCKNSPIPIALDEELIGVKNENKAQMISKIKPQYIILKPTLVGGFKNSEEWIHLAESNEVGWWITSALESNVGLNAIAQWTYKLNTQMPQGLGTGGLFTNNFPCPLMVKNATLHYEPSLKWTFNI